MDNTTQRFTRLPNSVLEWLFGPEHDLTFRQVRVLLVAFRFTYGFSRHSAPLSSRFIADLTGIDQGDVTRALKSIVEAGLLTVTFQRKIGFYTIVPRAYKNKKTRKVEYADDGDLPSRWCFTQEIDGDLPSKKQRNKDGEHQPSVPRPEFDYSLLPENDPANYAPHEWQRREHDLLTHSERAAASERSLDEFAASNLF